MESHIQKMIYVLKILSVAAIWLIKINTVVMLWSKMGNMPYNVNKLKTTTVRHNALNLTQNTAKH